MLLTHSRSKTVQKAGSGPPSATKPPQNHRDALYLITQPDSLLSLQNVREQPAVEREVEPGISVVPEEVNVCGADVGGNDDAVVPMVQIRLVTSLKVLPNQSALAEVEADPDLRPTGPLLLQYREDIEEALGIRPEEALIDPNQDQKTEIYLSNTTGFTQILEAGEYLGSCIPAEVVEPPEMTGPRTFTVVADLEQQSKSWRESRQEKLREVLEEPDLPQPEKEALLQFLATHHHLFSLDDGERGETDLTQMYINTGDSLPVGQPPRRIPFALRQEVAHQLQKMQTEGVIEPSTSPWSSPVVLVKKRDGTHRFCVDYRKLNSVTKPDRFPLPRIDDLLDQLGQSSYFSTLDLALGFWQIPVHPDSREKTAFVTHRGLFQFRVMPFGLTNAPAVFQRLMQRVLVPLNPSTGPDFVSIYLDDILVFSPTLTEHMRHLKIVLEKIAEIGLKLKPTKCRFAQRELEYLGHIVSRQGLKTNPRLVEAVERFPVPRSVKDTRSFLGLSSYYRKFIPNFAKTANPLHHLTRKGVCFQWTPECQAAFIELKWRLTTSPVLAYPDFSRGFDLETDASIQGIGAVLAQQQKDEKLHPIAYASRALSNVEKRYGITDLETLAVVWAISHFHHYLYGNSVTVHTDHTAIKAVLESPHPTGKHARWWTRVYGRGVKEVRILYRAGKENKNADALSRNPVSPAPEHGVAEDEVQISPVAVTMLQHTTELTNQLVTGTTQCTADSHLTPSTSESSRSTAQPLLQAWSQEHVRNWIGDVNGDAVADVSMLFEDPTEFLAVDGDTLPQLDTSSSLIPSSHDSEVANGPVSVPPTTAQYQQAFGEDQRKDANINEIIHFLETGELPTDSTKARKIALQESLFTLSDGTLYFVDPKQWDQLRAVVPQHLREQILQNVHSGSYGGHYSGPRLYSTLKPRWWWDGMAVDAKKFARSCPDCAVVTGGGRRTKPPLHPIPVSRPFQIVGIDIMDLPLTERGNRHVIVMQDLFTKWPLVFPVPDQKTGRIAQLVAEELVPMFGVPECLLSDRGTNLLSNLMTELCRMLGITKLNTTAYHPQCDGAVERFNCTLKTMLRKHAAKFGCQWDRFLPGILWAYRNTPHTSTGEKPSFLLFGVDCRSPTEAAFLPTSEPSHTDVSDYRQELIVSLSSARQHASDCIRKSQGRYKKSYDRQTRPSQLRLGDWVLVHFPQEESGRWRKLSRPWHGPYRVTEKSDPDVTCVKVYHPQDRPIHVHQSRVTPCPADFPAGYFWYGGRRRGPGRPPKWLDRFLQYGPTTCSTRATQPDCNNSGGVAANTEMEDPVDPDQEDNVLPERDSDPEGAEGTILEDSPPTPDDVPDQNSEDTLLNITPTLLPTHPPELTQMSGTPAPACEASPQSAGVPTDDHTDTPTTCPGDLGRDSRLRKRIRPPTRLM